MAVQKSPPIQCLPMPVGSFGEQYRVALLQRQAFYLANTELRPHH